MLPVSDDGGSTAEIVRVLGGPAVGDIRSRCLRLADDSNTEVTAASPCNIALHNTEMHLSGMSQTGPKEQWTCFLNVLVCLVHVVKAS